MCGIAGIWNSTAGAEAVHAQLLAMRGSIAHRGPDAHGLHAYPGGGLAHTRLAVLDCSDAANQPFAWAGGRYHLVYNGELYNFRQLRRELEGRGVAFHTSGDTEVLAAALAEWGVEALPRLNGIFAFAWHDAEEDSLLLARDRLGVKPLYYTQREGALAFSSELHALRVAGWCDGGIDRAALDAYLTLQYIPTPRSIYQGVCKLPAAHWMKVSPEGTSIGSYWNLRYDPDDTWTLATAAERYRELLRESVRMQRVSDVPLGAFLSGGLDSSTVVAELAMQSEEPVHTFTIGFDDAPADERPYARAVAQRFHTRHHEQVAEVDAITLLPQLVRHFGEPFADSSALPTWSVSKMAREHVTVALSGDGGDELFAGYTWLHRTLLSRRVGRLPAPLRAALGGMLARVPSPRARQLQRMLHDAGLPMQQAFARRLTMFPTDLRTALLGEVEQHDPVAEVWARVEGGGDGERMLGVDTLLYLPDDILTKVDRMSMAHALEVRVPLLDHRIVEFAATLPFHLKYARGQSKRLVKQAYRDVLPANVLAQRKRGFALPIDSWFRGALGGKFDEEIVQSTPRLAELLDVGVARKLYQEHQRGKENHGHKLWALLVLEEWLNQR